MAAAALSHPTHPVTKSPISIPFVVLSAVLVGVGILSLLFWLVTSQWIYFSGVLPCTIGALMFLDPRAGVDHA